MNTFTLKVIASDREFFSGQAESVVIPLADGEKQILANHENIVFATVMGEVRIKDAEGNSIVGLAGVGFTQVINNRVVVLVDSLEKPEEIDAARAREAEERAKEKLRQQQSIREYYHSQASLARAMERLKVSGRYKG